MNNSRTLSMSSSRQLFREEQDDMMKRFNDLNEQYNRRIEKTFFTQSEGIINFIDEKDTTREFVESNIVKMNDEFNIMLDKMNKLIDQQNIYENNKKKCISLIEKLRECNNLHTDLINSELKPNYTENSDISKQLISEDIISPLSLLLKNVETHINIIGIEIQSLRHKLSSFQKIVTNISQIKSSKLLCSICYTNQISHCLNPCGHTFCKTCIDRMIRICAGCRRNYTSTIKLFIQEDNEIDITNLDVSGNSSFSSIIPNSTYSELSTNRGYGYGDLASFDAALGGQYFN
jgi:hypothetical protein